MTNFQQVNVKLEQ